MANRTKNTIEDTIATISRDQIHSGDIVMLIVERSADSENVIVVNVIFDAKKNRLDVRETSQLSRHVWKRLIEMGETGFPSLSFIAKSEAGKLAAA